MMNVIEYCTEEVERQGHDPTTLDGIERVGWMLDAWSYAIEESDSTRPLPSKKQIIDIGKLIEPEKNAKGHRRVPVWVSGRACPPANTIPLSLRQLCDERNHKIEPLAFYRQLLEIHPFVDGNGRTGKVILNWLSGTLLDPYFPPNDFWGRPMRNP